MARFLLSAFADEANVNIDNQIKALQKNGIEYIEVRGVNGKNIIKLDDNEVKELKSKLDAEGIKVWSIGSPIGKIGIKDDFEPHFEDYKRAIEIAKMLECSNIRLFSFFIPNGEKAEDYRDEVMSRMNALLDYAEGTGVDLCHENEKDIYGDTAERNLDLFQTLGPRLKGIFDPANYIQCDVETLSAFKQLSKYTKYMHIKDARFNDKKVVPPGFGDGNIKEILTELNKIDADIVLTLEPHLTVFAGYSDLGDHTSLGTTEFVYRTNEEAFDAACDALKNILKEV